MKKVLDKGFVDLVSVMGDDIAVVRSARVSTGSGSKGPEKDKKLIDYLMRNGHETPFEHVVFTFHVKCPLFVARQWFRHRIASYNEKSGRYSKMDYEFYVPDRMRIPHPKNKQMSVPNDGRIDEKQAKKLIEDLYEYSYNVYQELLDMGIARELARIVLPLALYTEFYWTVNMRSLMNFLSLRADSHAQWEIQQYALAIAEYFKECCPWSYEAFIKYSYKGDLLKPSDS
jgi:thymidylate synthase (FAD)